MNEIIFLVEESEEGGYVARALGESIITQGETIAELKEQVKDAVKCHFELNDLPQTMELHFARNPQLNYPRNCPAPPAASPMRRAAKGDTAEKRA